jgi:MFS family permease
LHASETPLNNPCPKRHSSDFARELHIPVAAYSMAVLVFSTVPLMIGVLMDRQSLTASQAGLVSGMDLFGTVIPGFLLGSILPGIERRTLLIAGSMAIAIGNMLCLVFNGLAALVLIRTLSGLGAGLLFACSNAMLASTSDPVRAYGFASMGGTILGSVMLFTLPLLIVRFGSWGLYMTTALLAVAFVALGARAPRDPVVTVQSSIAATAWNIGRSRLALLAAGAMLLVIPQQAYWGFAERIGARAGASPELLGAVFSAAYIFGLAASGLATWISNRWGTMRMLTIGFGLQALAIITVCLATDRYLIFGSIIVQTGGICFGAPYLFGLGAKADESGRFGSVVVGLFFFAMAMATVLGGILVEYSGFTSIARLTMVSTALGLIAVYPAVKAVRIRQPARRDAEG